MHSFDLQKYGSIQWHFSHSLHIHRQGEVLVAVAIVISFFAASLLCLAFCMTRDRWKCCKRSCCCCCKRRSNRARVQEYSNLNDWVCDLERGGSGEGAYGFRGSSAETATARVPSQEVSAAAVDGEWEEVTVESIFPDILASNKTDAGKNKKPSKRQTEMIRSTAVTMVVDINLDNLEEPLLSLPSFPS